ncbi:MAG: SulP family inorganic anion transporter [Pseudomonadota bacterium]
MAVDQSQQSKFSSFFKEFNSDFPASIVVFFVALPLCLGIALASGAPLFSGVIAGIVGGIVVGTFSGSQLGVSGPAAGLAVIVLTAIATLGSFQAFLLAVVLAGVIQFIMGYLKAGFIAYFIPSSVIKGMLTGIGLLIILKQIPHALGYSPDFVGDESFSQLDGENTFTSLMSAWELLTPGATLIGLVSLAVLIFWDAVMLKKHRLFQILQGPIVVVLMGILFNYLYLKGFFGLTLQPNQMVELPVAEGIGGFINLFTYPDFSQWSNPEVIKIAIVMAIIASLETLLCVEAADKLDPLKRVTPTNQELKAQGIGNIVSGLIGGIPVTQVIVRSSANISFGAKTKLSAILHGVFMLISAVTIAKFLNMIPLASLAAILLMVGYKLTKPSLFKQMFDLGWEQFFPFVVTVVAIILTDLLTGIGIGLAVAILFTLHHSYRNSHYIDDVTTTEDDKVVHHLVLAEDVSFFNKASIVKVLEAIPKNSKVIIDCSNNRAIDYDVSEFIRDYQLHAKLKNITVETIAFVPPKS